MTLYMYTDPWQRHILPDDKISVKAQNIVASIIFCDQDIPNSKGTRGKILFVHRQVS